MTTPSELNRLAESVEAATAEDERELIQAAYEALRPEEMCWPDRLYDIGGALALAITLLPKDGCWTVEPDACWIRWMGKEDVEEVQSFLERRGGEATALAIVAACLREAASKARADGGEP